MHLTEVKVRGRLSIATSIPIVLFWGASGVLRAETAQPAWTSTYKGAEEVADLVLDAAGNVYVTGKMKYDYLTVKYNSAGVRQWAKRYNFSGNDETASAMALDGSGNLYVTGSSDGGTTAYDYATIKYSPNGARQWVARYNNMDNNSDFANDIAVDSAGNAYVTGGSRFDDTDYDIVTIKYDSAGVLQWGVRSIGPGILPGYMDDVGRFIALDAAGNVCVTGVSDLSSIDIVTVKLDPTGQQLWAMRYDGPAHGNDEPSGLVIDAAGNFYVAGTSAGTKTGDDIVLIKYNSSGVQQWVRRYTSKESYPEDVQDMEIDSAGNIYVTGSTNVKGYNGFLTMKYNSAGKRLWAKIYGAELYASGGAYGLDVDDDGNVYVTGGIQSETADEYATLKYNSSGQQQWAVRYTGPKKFDTAKGIAVDGSGNVFVSGDSYGSNGWTTIKYEQIPTP